MKSVIFDEGNRIIDFFNENIAKPIGVAPISYRRYIEVEGESEEVPITVWRQTPASELDLHQGDNEDGFRWKAVYNGIPHRPTYRPF